MQPSPLYSPSRRSFLKASAAALGAPLVAPLILAKPVAGANEKLNLAWVGFGNQGGGDLGACAGGNNIVGNDTAQFRTFLDAESKKWGDVIRTGNIKLDE